MGNLAVQRSLSPRFQKVRFSIRGEAAFLSFASIIITGIRKGGELMETQIRSLRKARGLTISALSMKANVNASLLSCMERRKVAAGNRARGAVSAFLGVSQSEIFDQDGFAV